MTTQELTTAVREVEKTVSMHDECIKDHGRQISEIRAAEKETRAEVKEQGKLLQSIDRLAMGLTRLDEKMGDLSCKIDTFGSRINMIELKPAEKWERIAYEVLKYVVLAGVGFLAAKLIGGV